MTDVKPPTPPNPAKAAKGVGGILKGKPAWMWVAGITVLVGVAYLAWHRSSTATAATGATVTPNPDANVGPVGGDYGYTTPAPTQGAFGGYDTPQTATPPADNAGTPEPMPEVVVNINPGPTSGAAGVDAPVPAAAVAGAAAATGGGTHPARGVHHHKAPPKHKPPKAKVKAPAKHPAHPAHPAPARPAPPKKPTKRRTPVRH